jgi:transcriptional regulator with XRE-family HTH domain/nucleoside 2-deoxyribosyltransferase
METLQPPELEAVPEPKLRAYLATALTDLPDSERQRVYELCGVLKRACAEFGVSLYLPFEHTDPLQHADVPPPVVYERDRKQVVTSDFVLVLCASASYGVGQENEIAAEHGIPVVYLVRQGCRVSRMLLGSDTRKLIAEYEDETDLVSKLRSILEDNVPALQQRRDAIGVPEPLKIAARIRDLRERSEISAKTLADLIGVDEQKLRRMEDNPEEEAGLTLSQLRSLAAFLKVDITYLLFGATSTKDERVRRSQDNLKVIARDESMEYRDFESLWGGYLDKIHQKIGYVAATKDNHIISKEQWRAWYRQLIEKRDELEIQF